MPLQAKFEQLKQEYATYSRILHESEEALNRANVDKSQCLSQLKDLQKQIERLYQEKIRLEDEILEKMRDQLTAEKAAQYTKKTIRQCREKTKDLETQVCSVWYI